MYDWAVEGLDRLIFLATGHYARISNDTVWRQTKDLGKIRLTFSGNQSGMLEEDNVSLLRFNEINQSKRRTTKEAGLNLY